MADNLGTTIEGKPAPQMTVAQEELLDEIMREFAQAQMMRATFAAQWEEAAMLIAPHYRNTFYYQNYNFPGQKKTHEQVDAHAMMALSRFTAICDSLLTPRNMFWHGMEADVEALVQDKDVKAWFEQVTKILFRLRYSPLANFAANNQQNYLSLGAFGNATMFIDQAVDELGNKIRGFRYKAVPLGETFFRENHQGLIDGIIRWFRLTPRQAYQKWGDMIPQALRTAMESRSEMPFNFLHRVVPNKEYNGFYLDNRGKKFRSTYVSLEGKCILSEGGYDIFPYAVSRYEQAPGEVYGRGPAQMVLPSLKTSNAEKRVFLKQGHRAGDPVLLTTDDGLVDFNMRPGALNKGGMNTDGKPLVGILPSGEIQITEDMMKDEHDIQDSAFLVSLFAILTETPSMTATEVIERTNEKGILVAPTMGRQGSEYLGPMIHREFHLAAAMGLLPPLPSILKRYKAGYDVVYTNPLARAMRAQEVSGLSRHIQIFSPYVELTGDPTPFDAIDWLKASQDTAEIQGVPRAWAASDKQIAASQKQRAQAAQIKQQTDAMPAQAAMLKAKAMIAKGAPGQGAQGQPPAGVPAPPGAPPGMNTAQGGQPAGPPAPVGP